MSLKLLLVFERAMQRGMQFCLALQVRGLIGCVYREQRTQRNALRVEGCICRIIARKCNSGVGLDRRVHCG